MSQRRHTGLHAYWLMTLAAKGAEGEFPGIAASPISPLSMVALEESVGGA